MSTVATSRHVDPTRRQQAVAAWALALPFVLLFVVFSLGPVLASLGMSFTDMRRADIRDPFAVNPVGLDNYVQLVQDPLFRKVTLNTLLYLLLGVPATMAVALLVAVGINRVERFRGFFRVGYYLPVVTSIVAVSVVWKFLYRDNGGLFNTVLGWVGIDGPGWLDSTTLSLPSLVLMAVWRNFGTLMVIFLAGLQTIPQEVNEAAEVDGASGWSRFRHITLPMLRPTLLFGAVITGLGYLQFFEEAFVMTKGGPLDSTRSVTYFTFDQFGFGNYGYAAAASYLLFLGLFVVVVPFVWMLLSSIKPEAEVRAVPPTWWPEQITLSNYDTLFTKLDFPTYFMNSAIVALAVTAGNMVFCSMLGYALAKLDFPGKRALFAVVLGTLMIPGVVTFVPLFVLTTKIGLSNTLVGMILPFLAGPFGVFLMRQFIQSLPDELIQAARIDGAGELRIFFSVILPLCGPALATLGILTFLTSWNNFLWPLVVAQTEDKYTLPVALALYAVGQNATQYGLLLAGSVVVVLPVLALFLALQRHIMQGIAMTGIK